MYRTSREQIFAELERIRDRAIVILGEASASLPPAEVHRFATEREALSIAAGAELRLPHLAATFSLSPRAVDVLLCLLAVEYDPYLRHLVRVYQREGGRPWLELGTVADLLMLPPSEMPALEQITSSGPLGRWALIQEEESGSEVPVAVRRLKINSRVARYLVEDNTLPDTIRKVQPTADLSESLAAAHAAKIVSRVRRALEARESLVVEIVGSPGTGRRLFAEGVARELGRTLVIADLGPVERRQLGFALAEAEREARLGNALLCLANWDSQLPPPPPSTEPGAPTPPRQLPSALRHWLERNSEVVLLTAEEREPLLEMHTTTVMHVAVPFPTPSQRARLLDQALQRRSAALASDVDSSVVARRFALDPRRIEIAAGTAVELMRARDPQATTVISTELFEACRHQLRHDLKSLAVRVTNSYEWRDLVIPVEVYHVLEEMISYVKYGQRVYDEWGFGGRHSLSQGISALFAGPPGTGKTMCASVMARELDMELFRVDLSRVVSKWIGETEKNLGKVFDEAQRSNAIILFDEADSLFAKRTDVKSSVDRYANLEVNFLLQRMEAFSGVTILTTNFEDTLDTAFKRRLTFRMRFEKPDADARAALWQKVFPPLCQLASDVDMERLGALYELSGGNIRNAAVRAAFLAAAAGKPVDMSTCMLAAEREAREMGLLVKSAGQVKLPAPAPVEEGEADVHLGEEAPQRSEPAPTEPPRTSSRMIRVTHPRSR